MEYHDKEWGVPVHDDRKLFEYLVLDSFQAGLSWSIILRKREALRDAFRGFDPVPVATMTERDVDALVKSPEIIRNRAKIGATVGNARTFLDVVERLGSFHEYLWSFVNGATIQNSWTSVREIPAQTDQSRMMSDDLRARGFRFVGPTICYAVMQSAGLVNDHVVGCYRHSDLSPSPASQA